MEGAWGSRSQSDQMNKPSAMNHKARLKPVNKLPVKKRKARAANGMEIMKAKR